MRVIRNAFTALALCFCVVVLPFTIKPALTQIPQDVPESIAAVPPDTVAQTEPNVQPDMVDTSVTEAQTAYMLDLSTKTVLLDKDSHKRIPTASMSKVMTMYAVFDAIKQGRLKLDDTLPVSEQAWRMQGSKTFVAVNTLVKVEDLIRGVIIQSGNDAAVVLAEGLGGSEAAFSAQITEIAHQLGMKDSNFTNATGWPDPNHYSSAHDLAVLADHIIEDHPNFYPYYSEKEFTYNGITQGNRNPLLYRGIGADGMKTGHTEEAGYGLIASAKRGNRRLVLVVTGLKNAQQRADESAKVLEWGFRNFDNYTVFKAGQEVVKLPVWLGKVSRVPVGLSEDLEVTLTAAGWKSLEGSVAIDAPLKAPVAAGQPFGTLTLKSSDWSEARVFPLVTLEPAEAMDKGQRMLRAFQELVVGSVNRGS